MKEARILSMHIQNMLVFQDIEILPDSKFNLYLGKNRQGKSAITKLIQAALQGSSDPYLIREDSDRGLLEIVLDDENVNKIKRVFTKKGQRLEVTDVRGYILKNPQAALNALMGNPFPFNPIDFVLAENRKEYLISIFNPKATPEMLADAGIPQDVLARLNFSKDGLTVLKDAEQIVYSERTGVNRAMEPKQKELSTLNTAIAGFDVDSFRPERGAQIERELMELRLKLTRARTLQQQAEKSASLRADLSARITEAAKQLGEESMSEAVLDNAFKEIFEKAERVQDEINRLTAELESTQEALEDVRRQKDQRDALTQAVEGWEGMLNAIQITDIPDVAGTAERLAELERERESHKESERLFAHYCDAENLKPLVEQLRQSSEDMTKMLNVLRKELPEVITKNSSMPIEGLSFDGDKVIIKGRSLDNFSTSELMRFSVDIVKELNKDCRLKVLCVDRAESLDDEAYEELRAQTEKDKWQYFVTMVARKGMVVPDGANIVEAGQITKGEQGRLC